MVSETWSKSSYSTADGACVEVRLDGTDVLVRDTKDRDGGTLRFTAAAWEAFINDAKDDAYDLFVLGAQGLVGTTEG